MSLLEFKGVAYESGARAHIQDMDFSLEAGQGLVAFGRSGSGKQTLLKLAAGILKPSAGSVVLDEAGARGGLRVGYVPNEGGLLSNMTLVENAAFPLVYHRLAGRAAAEKRARELFAGWGLLGQADRRPALTSIGAKRLAQIARALLAQPLLYVLEDPLDDVDAATSRLIRKAMDGMLREAGSACLLATGDPMRYIDWGSRFLYLGEGRIVLYEDRGALMKSEDAEVQVFLGK